MVRIGILSVASIVGRFVAASRECENAQVVAIAARDPKRAKAFADDAGIARVHESYEELLHDPCVNAVYIPLVNSLHHRLAMKALEAGKHVLVEKPIHLAGLFGGDIEAWTGIASSIRSQMGLPAYPA